MKLILKRVKCFFGFHEWKEETSFVHELTRQCSVCKLTEYMYKGIWIPMSKKDLTDSESEDE